MKKALELLLCATMLMGLLAGCGGSKEQSTGDSGDGEESAASAKVAYLTPSLDVPFWRYVRHGIEDELGKSGIECVTYDSKDDANTQLSNAQDALTKQVDAIIISPTDSASCVSVLSAAEEAGGAPAPEGPAACASCAAGPCCTRLPGTLARMMAATFSGLPSSAST